MSPSAYLQTRRRFIAAAPHEVFELLANPAMHPVIDGSGTTVRETWDASRLRHKWVRRLLGFTRTTGPNMERTLEQLAAQFPEVER